jgi:hypothetical protein
MRPARTYFTGVHRAFGTNTRDGEPRNVTASATPWPGTITLTGSGFTSVVTAQSSALSHAFVRGRRPSKARLSVEPARAAYIEKIIGEKAALRPSSTKLDIQRPRRRAFGETKTGSSQMCLKP